MLAAIRPDDVNLPLFLHVLGAMLLVGVLMTVATAFVLGRRSEPDGTRLTRFGLRTMLLAALPAYVLMRVGAQWTESEEGLGEGFTATWLDIGYITADAGALLIIVSMVLSARSLRRLEGGGGAGAARAVGIISIVLIAAYLVAMWAMTTKP